MKKSIRSGKQSTSHNTKTKMKRKEVELGLDKGIGKDSCANMPISYRPRRWCCLTASMMTGQTLVLLKRFILKYKKMSQYGIVEKKDEPQ